MNQNNCRMTAMDTRYHYQVNWYFNNVYYWYKFKITYLFIIIWNIHFFIYIIIMSIM